MLIETNASLHKYVIKILLQGYGNVIKEYAPLTNL